MRQIVLDTETTGLSPDLGDRVLEIGCVELTGRKIGESVFHQYINPERDSHPKALLVHKLSREFLSNKPLFSDIAESFLAFVRGAELIIHNATFDVKFINSELHRLRLGTLEHHQCSIVDTLELARQRYPGQRHSLDELCRRLDVDNAQRSAAHGALLDAQLLAKVYLAMTLQDRRARLQKILLMSKPNPRFEHVPVPTLATYTR